MPYLGNHDVPESIQRHLPPHALDICREAFNRSFAVHADDPQQEEAAHRIAWAAVKRSYGKVGNCWVGRKIHSFRVPAAAYAHLAEKWGS